jgi:hypothetical protein
VGKMEGRKKRGMSRVKEKEREKEKKCIHMHLNLNSNGRQAIKKCNTT